MTLERIRQSREGKVLSAENVAKVSSAAQALTEVLQAASIGSEPDVETSVDGTQNQNFPPFASGGSDGTGLTAPFNSTRDDASADRIPMTAPHISYRR